MATDKSDKQSPDAGAGKKPAEGLSMKERLLAQRRAEAEKTTGASSAPPVPAARPAATSAKSTASTGSSSPRRPTPSTGARGPEERAPRKQVSEDVRREIEMLKKRQDKWITYGWMVALGLLLIAGVTYYITSGQKRAAEEKERQRIESIRSFLDEAKALDMTKLDDIKKLRQMTEDPANDARWKVTDLDVHAKIQRMLSDGRRNEEEVTRKEEFQKGLSELEGLVTTAASMPAEDIAQRRRRVATFESGGGEMGVEFQQRVAKVKVAFDRAFVARLHDEAKTLAGKGAGEAKNALAAYTKAEDELIKLLDDAVRLKQEDLRKEYFDRFKVMITESDALVATIFTQDAIDKTAWLDLLTGPQKENWQHPGFSGWQIKDNVLQAVTDLGSKSTSIMSIGDREQWRDYVLELEFAVMKGDCDLHLRLGRAVNSTTPSYRIGTTGQGAFKPGATNTITATVIGSTVKLSYSDSEHSPSEELLNEYKSRKGGIGISVPPGAEIKISKMRIRPLR